MRNSIKLLLAFLLFTAIASETRAESVVITGGSHTTGHYTGGPFTLIGEGLTLNGRVYYANPLACAPCRAGELLQFGSYNLGSDIAPGSGTVNGIQYARLFYDGFLRFSVSVIVPFDSSPLITLTAPFAFDGDLAGCTQSTVSGCPGGYVFSTGLVGQGIATLVLASQDSGLGFRLYNIRSVAYNFQPQSIPEPATFLLLGTSLIVAAVVRKQRKLKGRSL